MSGVGSYYALISDGSDNTVLESFKVLQRNKSGYASHNQLSNFHLHALILLQD